MYKYKCLNPIAKFGLDHFTREYKEVEELEEAEKAATDRWDALHQEFIALDDSHIETSLNLYRATALSFLERFCAGEDWLMAACVVEDSDKLFNRHDPENISIGHPPAAVEEWYFQLREQTLDEAGSLVVEQFRNKPEDENYTERVYILAENSRYGPEAVAALGAEGATVLSGLRHIDRGYEGLEGMLQALGARVERREE